MLEFYLPISSMTRPASPRVGRLCSTYFFDYEPYHMNVLSLNKQKSCGETIAAALPYWIKREGEHPSIPKGSTRTRYPAYSMPHRRINVCAALSMLISPRRAIISTPYSATPESRFACEASISRSLSACARIISSAGPM